MAGVPLTLSNALRGQYPENDRELTYRSAMLPLGTYRNSDGTESPGFAWPGMITEPVNALERLGSGGFSNPQDQAAQQDMTTLLLSLYGGNALNPLARVPKGALTSGLARRSPESLPVTYKAYRGYDNESGGPKPGYWAADDPLIAADYAPAEYGGRIEPVNMTFNNPLEVDAMGARYDAIPFRDDVWSTDGIARLAQRNGYDGAVIRNVVDSADKEGRGALPPSTSYVALKPGTVRSATTGEILFSDTGRHSLMGSALSSEQNRTPSMSHLLRTY